MTVTLDKNAESFVATPHKLFINGQWADAASGKAFETPNPATGETLARIAEGGAEDIDRAVQAARKALARISAPVLRPLGQANSKRSWRPPHQGTVVSAGRSAPRRTGE
jgi:Aldehyde dehydrogenase family